MFELFSIIPTSLILYWGFFVLLCIMPMVLAVITDKKDQKRKNNIKA